MFGTYRFVLAVLVALSHFGLRKQGFNPGQWAVIGFYVLSGLLMHRQYVKLGSWFIADRLLRVLPLYWVVVALTALALPLANPLADIALLPLTYLSTPAAIPPAWSLAAELHFYLAVPLLFRLDDRALRILAWASLAVFAASPWMPESTWWGYKGPVGTLFTFAAGMLVARGTHIRGMLPVVALLLAGFSAAKLLHLDLPCGIHINVCIGFLLAMPLLRRLNGAQENQLGSKLGELTFPLFLCHELVKAVTGWTGMLELLAVSLAMAWVLAIVIERPADKLRHLLRSARRTQPAYR